MKLRKQILATLLMTVSISAMAFSGIEVTMSDGSSMVISMDERPVVTFSGSKLVIKTETSTTELERSKVKTFNYLSSSSIEENNVGDSKVNNTGDALLFSNLPAGSEIKVHSVDGKLVKSAAAEGSYRINISDLSAGVYVVSVNGVSTKISVNR